MPNTPQRNFKIAALAKQFKPYEHDLTDDLVYCTNIGEFKETIQRNDLPNLILACDYDTLIDILPLLVLNNGNIATIYVLSGEKEIFWPFELIENNCELVHVNDEKQLIIYLYLKAMLCYFQQGEELQHADKYGLANLFFQDAKNALEHAQLML